MVLLHTHPNHLAVNLLGLLTTDASTVSAYWSAYQIYNVIFLIVILVFKV
jgi:hypothetical protein